MTTGLYRDTWDKVEFLVSECRKSRYKKVRNEEEGVAFIKKLLPSKGFGAPSLFERRKGPVSAPVKDSTLFGIGHGIERRV